MRPPATSSGAGSPRGREHRAETIARAARLLANEAEHYDGPPLNGDVRAYRGSGSPGSTGRRAVRADASAPDTRIRRDGKRKFDRNRARSLAAYGAEPPRTREARKERSKGFATRLAALRPGAPRRPEPSRTDPVRSTRARSAQNRSAQNRPDQNRPAQNRPAQNRPAQNRPAQNRPAQSPQIRNRPAQGRRTPARFAHARPPAVGSAPARTRREASPYTDRVAASARPRPRRQDPRPPVSRAVVSAGGAAALSVGRAMVEVARPAAAAAAPMLRVVTGGLDRVPTGNVAEPAARGRVLIVIVGLLAAGLIYINVGKLEAGDGYARFSQRSLELQRENTVLRARVANLGSSERIVSVAKKKLDMVMPQPEQFEYLHAKGGDSLKAIRNYTPPAPPPTPSVEAPLPAAPQQPVPTTDTGATPPAPSPEPVATAPEVQPPQPADQAPGGGGAPAGTRG